MAYQSEKQSLWASYTCDRLLMCWYYIPGKQKLCWFLLGREWGVGVSGVWVSLFVHWPLAHFLCYSDVAEWCCFAPLHFFCFFWKWVCVNISKLQSFLFLQHLFFTSWSCFYAFDSLQIVLMLAILAGFHSYREGQSCQGPLDSWGRFR